MERMYERTTRLSYDYIYTIKFVKKIGKDAYHCRCLIDDNNRIFSFTTSLPIVAKRISSYHSPILHNNSFTSVNVPIMLDEIDKDSWCVYSSRCVTVTVNESEKTVDDIL